jgi:hypothetical protein
MQVLDLFDSAKLKLPIKEWVDASKRLPTVNKGTFKVKLENGDEVFAYFMRDKNINAAKSEAIIGAERLCDCSATISHWWDRKTSKPINITYWGIFDERKD